MCENPNPRRVTVFYWTFINKKCVFFAATHVFKKMVFSFRNAYKKLVFFSMGNKGYKDVDLSTHCHGRSKSGNFFWADLAHRGDVRKRVLGDTQSVYVKGISHLGAYNSCHFTLNCCYLCVFWVQEHLFCQPQVKMLMNSRKYNNHKNACCHR